MAVAIPPSGSLAYVLTQIPGAPQIQQLRRLDLAGGAFIAGTLNIGNSGSMVLTDLQVSPDGQRLYVTNPGDDTISVIRTSDFTKLADVAVGDGPVGIGVSPDSSQVYVTNYLAQTISIVNAASMVTTGTIDVSSPSSTLPSHVVVSPDGTTMYVSFANGEVKLAAILTNGPIIQTLAGTGPFLKVAYVPSLSKLYSLEAFSDLKQLTPATLQVDWTLNHTGVAKGMDWVESVAPTITSVAPNTACKAGGTIVTVNGSAFQGEVWDGLTQVQQRTRVFIGGVEATPVLIDSTQLRVMAPAHAQGYVNVEVRNPDGKSATLTNGLRYTFCQL